MEPHWAVTHLQVIRTLMERSAIYRRALGPVMLFLGMLGVMAMVVGYFLPIQSAEQFGWFWMGTGVLGVLGAFVMVRRQALRESESFWSPPTRRVTQAFLPPLFAGMVIGTAFTLSFSKLSVPMMWLPTVWMILYGCAAHAAGFFMPRGMKLFGWGFVCAGCGLACATAVSPSWPVSYAHWTMGLAFGGGHLAYGIYLYFTEQRKSGT